MRFVIVTGMSGAGKSTVLKSLEDDGYFCVDNMPIVLIDKFIELFANSSDEKISRIAVGIDIRSGKSLSGMKRVLEGLKKRQFQYEILFLESRDDILIKRYKETRRSHPLSRDGRIFEGLEKERKAVAYLKTQADYIIDTSDFLIRDLKKEVDQLFLGESREKKLIVTILSFGFKNGMPGDADLVFDVRFLPNPYYIEELKHKSGLDQEVQDYVMQFDVSKVFLEKLLDMVRFLVPNYVEEGKSQLVIAIGCTGGRHRSVTFAEALYHDLRKENDCKVHISHRDIQDDLIRKQLENRS
jgi:UPF0042 nucleotide-binding protein